MLDLEYTYINIKQDFARFKLYGDAGQAVIFELNVVIFFRSEYILKWLLYQNKERKERFPSSSSSLDDKS